MRSEANNRCGAGRAAGRMRPPPFASLPRSPTGHAFPLQQLCARTRLPLCARPRAAAAERAEVPRSLSGHESSSTSRKPSLPTHLVGVSIGTTGSLSIRARGRSTMLLIAEDMAVAEFRAAFVRLCAKVEPLVIRLPLEIRPTADRFCASSNAYAPEPRRSERRPERKAQRLSLRKTTPLQDQRTQ